MGLESLSNNANTQPHCHRGDLKFGFPDKLIDKYLNREFGIPIGFRIKNVISDTELRYFCAIFADFRPRSHRIRQSSEDLET